jgi:hypothetical protein
MEIDFHALRHISLPAGWMHPDFMAPESFQTETGRGKKHAGTVGVGAVNGTHVGGWTDRDAIFRFFLYIFSS